MQTHSDYAHCVLSGTDVAASGQGFPDGDTRPTLTTDYKQILTFKPSGSGVVDVLLAPSATSAINVITGIVTGASFSGMDASAATTTGFTTSSVTPGTAGVVSLGTLAGITEGLAAVPMTGAASDYRPIVLVADFDYSGSSMMDSGFITVQRYNNSERIAGTLTIDATTDYSADFAYFEPIVSANAIRPDAQTMPAREGFTTRIVPVDPKFETCRVSVANIGTTTATNMRPLCHPSSLSAPTIAVAPSYHSACDWTRITITGLDASASMTVTIRYCVQYAISSSETSVNPGLQALARPSPPANPGIVTRVTNIVRELPLATKKRASIWDFVKKAGKAFLPTLLPGIGGVISSFL